MNKIVFIVIIVMVIIAAAVYSSRTGTQEEPAKQPVPQNSSLNESDAPVITLETNFGVIKFKTYPKDAPRTVENFITLAEKGFYNGLTFHRVISGFMIQGGDPNCNSSTTLGPCGAGGPGYKFDDELDPRTPSYQEGYKKGVVAMANAGPNTNGSQFFIMLEDYPLPNLYTIFGKVIEGQEVVDAIGRVSTGANDRPLQQITIERVKVEM
ncbi:MAG TPA: peptidylprolyl isomerase [Candidatus Paceibacterota bacterium]|nr:peptidylprolyl isomerase [Candidatus Paceibacterota bacterium]